MAELNTLNMTTYKFLTNLIVNNDSLSTGGRGNQTLSTNKNIMDTSTNATYTYKDMDYDSLYILINDVVQDTRYDPGPLVNNLYFPYKL